MREDDPIMERIDVRVGGEPRLEFYQTSSRNVIVREAGGHPGLVWGSEGAGEATEAFLEPLAPSLPARRPHWQERALVLARAGEMADLERLLRGRPTADLSVLRRDALALLACVTDERERRLVEDGPEDEHARIEATEGEGA